MAAQIGIDDLPELDLLQVNRDLDGSCLARGLCDARGTLGVRGLAVGGCAVVLISSLLVHLS